MFLTHTLKHILSNASAQVAQNPQAQNPIMSFLPLILVFIIFYLKIKKNLCSKTEVIL
jgi:hypothetical protein